MQNYLIYIILILSRLELEYHSYQKCALPVKLKNLILNINIKMKNLNPINNIKIIYYQLHSLNKNKNYIFKNWAKKNEKIK